jgi:hypothetical protein
MINGARIEMALERHEAPVKDLSVQEEKRLEQLEGFVFEGFKSDVKRGIALFEIQERKLWRMKAPTFEKYCSEFFDLARRRAYQLINAARVIENVNNCSQKNGGEVIEMVPMNEAQARPLTGLRPEQQIVVWRAAVESAPNGKISASHVKKVVKEYLGEKITKTVRQAQAKVRQSSSIEFTNAFDQLSQQIIKERNSNYKYTSRGEIVKALDQLRAEIAEDGDPIEDTVFHGGSNDRLKLQKAGFSLFRTDRSSMTIKKMNDNGAWGKHSGGYGTIKEMEAAFAEILQDDMHLRG